MTSTRVCPHIDAHGHSCPNLAPCEKHSRPANAPWTKGRNSTQQGRDRRNTLRRDNHTCQRCGRVDITGKNLDAHHVTPTQLVTLCNSCHVEIDSNARKRP